MGFPLNSLVGELVSVLRNQKTFYRKERVHKKNNQHLEKSLFHQK